jgi:hypothetical protein
VSVPKVPCSIATSYQMSSKQFVRLALIIFNLTLLLQKLDLLYSEAEFYASSRRA